VRVLIAGSSGFLGTALRERLAERGHDVVRLVRREAGPGESSWDPYAGRLDQEVVDTADVVVNLAGAPLLGNPHSGAWARRLRESRVVTTRLLAEAVARSHTSGVGGHPAYLAQNGSGWYGDHGATVLDEEAGTRGDAFFTELTRAWQDATTPAVDAGARVCVMRTPPVVDRRNPPFKQMWPLFRLGLGGRVGDGRQYFPVISTRDWVAAATHLVEGEGSGPFNMCCPTTPTHREFTDALAQRLGRRARLSVPARLVDVAAGRFGSEVVSSFRLEPAALQADGFEFADEDVRDVVATAARG